MAVPESGMQRARRPDGSVLWRGHARRRATVDAPGAVVSSPRQDPGIASLRRACHDGSAVASPPENSVWAFGGRLAPEAEGVPPFRVGRHNEPFAQRREALMPAPCLTIACRRRAD